MNNKLLETTVQIFDTIEKWKALFELHDESSQIIKYWLQRGAEATKREFMLSPSQGWSCGGWQFPHEVFWSISGSTSQSIGIGFGWENWEFHLALKNDDRELCTRSRAKLKDATFKPLLAFFPDDKSSRSGGSLSLASDQGFNPFNEINDKAARMRELAWYAAHEPGEFAKKMAEKVRQLTENEEATRLIRELNVAVGLASEKR